MRKSVLYFLTGGTLFLLVFFVTLGMELPPSYLENRIEKIADRMGTPVALSEIDYHPLTGLGFEKARIFTSDRSRSLLDFQDGEINFDLFALFKNRLQVAFEGSALEGSLRTQLQMHPLTTLQEYRLVLHGKELDLTRLNSMRTPPPARIHTGEAALTYSPASAEAGRADGGGIFSLRDLSLELTNELLRGLELENIQGTFPYQTRGSTILLRDGSFAAKGASGTLQGTIERGTSLQQSKLDLQVELHLVPSQLDKRIALFVNKGVYRFRIQGEMNQPSITSY